jgi:hypothetical protein
MLTTITILNLKAEPVMKRAVVDGVFAVTPGHPRDDADVIGVWTVTHVPTGAAVLTAFSVADARRAQQALAALPLDWTSKSLGTYRRRRKYRAAVAAVRVELLKAGIQVQM